MRFLTVILTAPRPQSTLERTVQSIRDAGFDTRKVELFSGAPPEGEKPSPRWCTAAYQAIFREFLAIHNDPDLHLLVFEDDVVACRGLYDYLVASRFPEPVYNVGMVTPYCPTAYSNYNRFPKWHREDQRSTLAGTQCFLYTRNAIQHFADALDPLRRHPHHHEAYLGVDVQLGELCKKLNLHVWYHVPSLCQHIGICNSAVGFESDLGTIYSAETFVGESFDARTML